MGYWFYSVFTVVRVVNACPVHAVDLRGLSSSLDNKMYIYIYC